ncbi:response regulator transcription factor [Paenibacillus daejeonensis]|uniref:response regulator transcription factor n=1 Tax=Paenibacillus daejeonensis TaxID=135193 RepID=UPI0003703BD5|nr:response regulator [Paenibacillus daejeonensis]
MKICVIDDELGVRTSIIQKLTALFPDAKVFNGEYGLLALDRIELIRPDLIFLDIRMPDVDGLDILKQVKRNYPAIYVVIISGYDEFEYARQSLQLGATDYLLKPADRVKLREIVEKIKVEQEQAALQEMGQCLAADPMPYISVDQIRLYNASLWFDEREAKRIVVLSDKIAQPELKHVLLTIVVREGLELIIVRTETGLQADCFREKRSFTLVLKHVIAVEQEQRFFGTARDVSVGSPVVRDKAWSAKVHKLRLQVIHAARAGQQDELGSALAQWLAELERPGFTELVKECATLMAQLDEGLMRREVIFIDEAAWSYWYEWVTRHSNWQQLREGVQRMVLGGVKALQDVSAVGSPVDEHASGWFQQALDIIAQSEDMQLTLEMVADAVNVHPVTLSRTFKQRMGLNFVHFLTKKKMNASRKLLLTSDKRITEIAEMMGYTDQSYFRSLFKKEFGYSPSELRRQSESRGGRNSR